MTVKWRRVGCNRSGLQAGMTVTVDGISCRVRSVLPINDGMTRRAEIVSF